VEGCSNATVNRHLALLWAKLRRCVRDWEWLDRAPTIRLLKEPTRRIRFLSQTQALTLLHELPPHLRDMATFALVTGLIWDQVDLSRKLAWVQTWASWHIQSGTPLFALQELGGWETERMVRRYAHLAADHLAVYVGNAQIHGTFLAHQPTLPKPLDEKAFESQYALPDG